MAVISHLEGRSQGFHSGSAASERVGGGEGRRGGGQTESAAPQHHSLDTHVSSDFRTPGEQERKTPFPSFLLYGAWLGRTPEAFPSPREGKPGGRRRRRAQSHPVWPPPPGSGTWYLGKLCSLRTPGTDPNVPSSEMHVFLCHARDRDPVGQEDTHDPGFDPGLDCHQTPPPPSRCFFFFFLVKLSCRNEGDREKQHMVKEFLSNKTWTYPQSQMFSTLKNKTPFPPRWKSPRGSQGR